MIRVSFQLLGIIIGIILTALLFIVCEKLHWSFTLPIVVFGSIIGAICFFGPYFLFEAVYNYFFSFEIVKVSINNLDFNVIFVKRYKYYEMNGQIIYHDNTKDNNEIFSEEILSISLLHYFKYDNKKKELNSKKLLNEAERYQKQKNARKLDELFFNFKITIENPNLDLIFNNCNIFSSKGPIHLLKARLWNQIRWN